MKKKSTSHSAFLNLRVLFGLCVMLAGVFLALVSFGPARTGFAQGITRQQMTLTLAQALNLPQPPACVPGAEIFNDVPASSPFCPFIEELSRRGITGGCAPGLYCPTAFVTRQQMAVFLVNTANQEGVPVAGANIDAAGTVLSFFNHRGGAPTVSHVAASGRYDITFPGLEGQVAFDGALASVTLIQGPIGQIRRGSFNGNAIVFTSDSAGVAIEHNFEIVVIRPGGLLALGASAARGQSSLSTQEDN
jgi:S-layer homology domain